MRALSRRLMLSTTIGGFAALSLPLRADAAAGDTEWTSYGGNLAYWRYAPLDQINAANFNSLEVAWQFKADNYGPRPEGLLEATPLMIRGRLFTTVGSRRDVVCLDGASGEVIWMHRSPDEGERARNAPRQLSGRGVGYWTDGNAERILYVTIGYVLLSLDASTGLPDPNFGINGAVDLKQNDDQNLDLVTSDIGLHSAPTVARNVVIHRRGAYRRQHAAGQEQTPRAMSAASTSGLAGGCGSFHTIPQRASSAMTAGSSPARPRKAGNTGDWKPDQRRRGTGAGLSGRRDVDRRPDGHLPRRQRAVQRKHRRGGDRDRQAPLALPDGASRAVGLRRALRRHPLRHSP